MEPEFIAVFQPPTPVHNYLKIIPPHLPIYYFLQTQSEQYPIILINHPKAQLKTAIIHSKQDKISENTSKDDIKFQEITIISEKTEINMVSILIKESFTIKKFLHFYLIY